MTDKMEVLGRVSEYAREIDGDDPPAIAVQIAMKELNDAMAAERPAGVDWWPEVEAALEVVAAAAVNYLTAGPTPFREHADA